MRHVFSASVVFLASNGFSAGLVLNEYNAVGSTKWLGNPDTVPCTGPDGFACAENEDTYFGRVLGNGGNWIELVVTTDHLDIRGWKLRWAETQNSATNGQDLWYGSATVEQGIVTFSNDPVWADLRAGTILTVHEFAATSPEGQVAGGKDDDFTLDPCNGDWWLSVHTYSNSQYVTTTTNVVGNGPGNLSVGNDGWLVEVRDASNALVTGKSGEGAPTYGGGGINSREICRLEQDPAPSTGPLSPYDDGDQSSCGSPNNWNDPISTCRVYQDFAELRATALAECRGCTRIILNEYNAVDDAQYLNGGDSRTDGDGGAASDSHFGRIIGNGGNWFELVVIEDGLDLRGWRFDWEKASEGEFGSIQLAANPGLASLAAGTIVTVIDNTAASGNVPTDLTLDRLNGDRWINVNSFDTSVVSGTTSNIRGDVSGDFSTSNNEWRLTIRDAEGLIVFGPVGEGAVTYYRGGVSATNICRLKDDPSPRITPASAYDDANDYSTFGAPNQIAECPFAGVTVEQSFAALPADGCAAAPTNPADLNGDGVVNGADLAILLGSWGTLGADIDGNGTTDGADLAIVLGSWG